MAHQMSDQIQILYTTLKELSIVRKYAKMVKAIRESTVDLCDVATLPQSNTKNLWEK